MSNQRQYPRTPMKCRIKISHSSFGDVFGHTRDLSDGGVYVRHEVLAALPAGSRVTGQVQDMPFDAPILEMEVMRTDAEGAGFRFVDNA